jgi:hypothetical protein
VREARSRSIGRARDRHCQHEASTNVLSITNGILGSSGSTVVIARGGLHGFSGYH